MTFRDATGRGQLETLSFEFDLAHPPEKVWRALTDPELLAEWLLPAVDFGLDPATEFTFEAPPRGGARYGWRMMGEKLEDLLGRRA